MEPMSVVVHWNKIFMWHEREQHTVSLQKHFTWGHKEKEEIASCNNVSNKASATMKHWPSIMSVFQDPQPLTSTDPEVNIAKSSSKQWCVLSVSESSDADEPSDIL